MGSEKKMTTELEKIDKKILKLNKELRPLENKRHKLKKAEEFDKAKNLFQNVLFTEIVMVEMKLGQCMLGY